MPSLQHYQRLDKGIVDPEEIRRLVAKGKESGMIRESGKIVPITKNGMPATAAGTVLSQWMEVTPGLAAMWLQNNVVNRTLTDDTVNAYARDMANGQWAETHQGIAFNDEDHLIDGQHRLHAIIRSGRTVRMMVTFGLRSKIAGSKMTTMDAVDRGRPRSVADQLKIQHGLKNGSAIAMICASIACICRNDKTRRLSVGQTLEIYEAFRSQIDWVIDFRPSCPGLRAKGVLAACAFALAGDKELKSPILALFTGDLGYTNPGSPLHLLFDFLISDDARLLNRGSDRALAELVLQAIHLHLAGESVPKLELSQAGLQTFRALQPVRVGKIAAMFDLP